MFGVNVFAAPVPVWSVAGAHWLPALNGFLAAAPGKPSFGDVVISLLIAIVFAGGWLGLASRKWVARGGEPEEPPAGDSRVMPSPVRTATGQQAVRLSLGNPYCAEGLDPELLVSFAAMASQRSSGDPLDILLLRETALPPIPPGWRLISYQEENAATGRSEALLEEPDHHRVRVTKGDPLTILPLCETTETDSEAALEAARLFAAAGYRPVAVARSDRVGNWHLLGILPVRKETAADRQPSAQAG